MRSSPRCRLSVIADRRTEVELQPGVQIVCKVARADYHDVGGVSGDGAAARSLKAANIFQQETNNIHIYVAGWQNFAEWGSHAMRAARA